jgi:hypothetical protein
VCAATKSRESGFSQKVNPNVTFFQCRMEGGLLEKLRIDMCTRVRIPLINDHFLLQSVL